MKKFNYKVKDGTLFIFKDSGQSVADVSDCKGNKSYIEFIVEDTLCNMDIIEIDEPVILSKIII